ncbi:scavenger receptor cysteine-rich domain-containing protein DMBT1-like [Mobula birostris]|uniref:scavenger receptor cysteine-rich domain-containing protein DMBT1-like n=1 Tax=Mobula birostris TaxID=1983395 RepID=UPI003B284B24
MHMKHNELEDTGFIYSVCGGYLYNLDGSFLSPGYPYSYSNSETCVWYIRVSHRYIIDLWFTDIDLEVSSSCHYDYVAIYDGPSTAYNLLEKLCRASNGTFTSSSNSMTVHFRTDSSVTRRGFAANYRSLPINNGYSCGGFLDEAFGSIMSPNYPNLYPNSAECTWYIRTNSSKVIYLRITDLELEAPSSCSFDFVAVYDGPTRNSPLLDKFCREPNSAFTSSSNSMTVYFRTDGSVTRRGFTASYHTLPSNYAILTCSTNYMDAKVDKSYLSILGFNESSLHLNDQSCTPIITADKVEFTIPLDQCGTIREVNNGSIIYSNTIRSSPSDSTIVRTQYLQINIGCEMQQDTMVKVIYVANENSAPEIIHNLTESGMFRASMNFYESSLFATPVSDSPYYVDLLQNLFVQVNLSSSDARLKVFVDTCVASPYNFNSPSISYYLIKNGCVRDETYDTLPSPANNIARFQFSAFKFLNAHSSVYLRCKLVICEAYDYSSRCYRGCMSRQKRATVSSKGNIDVTLGPIELKGE